jgi:hypothetical protein
VEDLGLLRVEEREAKSEHIKIIQEEDRKVKVEWWTRSR